MTKEALLKIETFVKLALDEISSLEQRLAESQIKQASEAATANQELDKALKKAAEAMYSADFITDADEKTLFVKKAKDDATYLAKVVERVCNASDVAFMGKMATVKSSAQTDDPVMRRAFGYDINYSLFDE
jgi:hypothetical protein